MPYQMSPSFHHEAIEISSILLSISFNDSAEVIEWKFRFRQTITKYENDKSFAKKFTAKIRRMVTNQAMSYPLPGPNAAKCKLLIPS